VDAALASRIEHEADPRARVGLWLARARLQQTHLGSPRDAMASLRAALAIDPRHPSARRSLVDVLAALGEALTLLEGLVELAAGAPAAERVRLLTYAGEMAEFVLLDDDRATELYELAREKAPDDPWLDRCRMRVLRRRARSGRPGEWLDWLDARQRSGPGDGAAVFEFAEAQIEGGSDAERARGLLERVLAIDPAAPHGLRALEHLARSTASAPLLANALADQAAAWSSPAAKVGALWAEAALVEWKLPASDSLSIAESILRYAPNDRAALDATLRQSVSKARTGDPGARRLAVAALRARLAKCSDESERLFMNLSIALLLDGRDRAQTDAQQREALEAYREALRIDGQSVVAAAGTSHLAAMVGDAEASVAAALANAELAGDDSDRRAALLVAAAAQLLGAEDARLGARPERLARAGVILERALDAAPDCLPAASLLVAVRSEDGARERLVSALGRAFDRATETRAVVVLGAEVARVAVAADPPNRLLAIEVLRRVLTVVPGHAQTLRALADQCLAQGAVAEATEALEKLGGATGDAKVRLDALLQLAELYDRRLARPADAERVLLAALDVDPAELRALETLLARARAGDARADRVAAWLERIADVQRDPAAKASALDELAAIRSKEGDGEAAERALVEAMAQAPTPARLQCLLRLYPLSPDDQARVLRSTVARANKLGRSDAHCIAELGRLESALGRWVEAVADLRVAVGLAPGNLDARAALAEGLLHVGAAAEATATVAAMIAPAAAPIVLLRDPAAALGTFERGLVAEGRGEEAVVARELRVVAGGLDDGAQVELRTRRLAVDPSAPVPTVLDAATLRGALVPREAMPVLLDLASAMAGADGKLTGVDLDDVGVGPRDRLAAGSGHPLVSLVQRTAAILGIPRPEVALSDSVSWPRVVLRDAGWIVVPSAMQTWAEPVQAVALAGPLVRIALALPWLDDLPSAYAHAVLCAAARTVVPGYASEVAGDQQDLIEEVGRRVAKAIGRKQRKALANLAVTLGDGRVPTLQDVAAFEQAIARTELRVGFIVTGDLLATLDVVRARDKALADATATVGAAALRATLSHPLAGDTARFALAPLALQLRWRVGTFWGGVG
jgi:tetratricopeptide (TPR) repeat protein